MVAVVVPVFFRGQMVALVDHSFQRGRCTVEILYIS